MGFIVILSSYNLSDLADESGVITFLTFYIFICNNKYQMYFFEIIKSKKYDRCFYSQKIT